MKLTTAQEAYLRSRARTLSAEVAVGKSGLDAGAIAHVRKLLDQHELVKVRLHPSAGADRKALAAALAESTKSALVDLVGRVVVLYRQNRKTERRLALPE